MILVIYQSLETPTQKPHHLNGQSPKTSAGSTLLGENMGIKPGPKPVAKSTGKEDKRQRVTPDNQPKHPGLKPHEHKKGE
uniref:hypothetical protein n=1 Tax=Rahnella aquatilis TaxID=34038 RepID=UPI00159ED9E5|nr:hypothetical protein [Rahnella aquatilis]